MKALVTGATSGIGKKIAEKLSEKGWELILTGRNEDVLAEMKNRLGNTEIIAADLSKRKDVYGVYEFCKDRDIDMLVNNAGFGVFGKFVDTDLDSELEMIDVNITAVHILMKLFLRDFRKRNRGIILNVASVAGFMHGPLMSGYYASKNYVLRLSLAVHEELRREKSNVSITVFCPGPVDTQFNSRAGVNFSAKPITADYAAEYALKKAFAGNLLAVPGLTAKVCAFGQRFAPYKLLSMVAYHIQHAKKSSDVNRRC